MNELVLFDTKAIANINFEDEALQRVSLSIAENMSEVASIYADAKERTERVNRALAPLFAEVVNGKLYEKGGYKSLEEYSEGLFGIKKSMAYMLARVGNAFFLTDNEYTQKARDTFTVSTLAELCKSDRVAIAEAINSGELNADTDQKTVRDWGNTHRVGSEPGKERVVPTYDLYIVHPTAPNGKRLCAESLLRVELNDRAFTEAGFTNKGYIATVKFDGDKPSAAQHFVAVSESGTAFLFEYRPHVTSKAKKASKKARDAFDLQAYLATLTPEQLAGLQELAAEMMDNSAEEGEE